MQVNPATGEQSIRARRGRSRGVRSGFRANLPPPTVGRGIRPSVGRGPMLYYMGNRYSANPMPSAPITPPPSPPVMPSPPSSPPSPSPSIIGYKQSYNLLIITHGLYIIIIIILLQCIYFM